MSTADPRCPVASFDRSTHRSPPHHAPHSEQNAGVQYFLTSPVCQRLFQPTKPHAATSMHHSVDHLITHGNADQAAHATTGWSTSIRTLAFLQLIYGTGRSSADTERCYGPGWLTMMTKISQTTEYAMRNIA